MLFLQACILISAILTQTITASSNSKPLAMSYYDVLGLKADCTEGELKKRYRTLAREFHPDKIADPKLKDEAQATFVHIAKGYETLSDGEKRKKYGNMLKAGMFEYDEDRYEEWEARLYGWRSDYEIQRAESFVFWTMVLTMCACVGGSLYYVHRKQEAKRVRAERAKVGFISSISAYSKGANVSKTEESQKKSAHQLQQQKYTYQANLRAYEKTLKRTIRTMLVQEHGLWFATHVSSEDISTLCLSLPLNELSHRTTQLCNALSEQPPTPPTAPSGEKDELIFLEKTTTSPSVRKLLRMLSTRASELRNAPTPVVTPVDE